MVNSYHKSPEGSGQFVVVICNTGPVAGLGARAGAERRLLFQDEIRHNYCYGKFVSSLNSSGCIAGVYGAESDSFKKKKHVTQQCIINFYNKY